MLYSTISLVRSAPSMSTRCIATLSANCLAPCVKRPVVTKTPRLVWAQPLGKTVVGMLAFSRCHLGVLWTRLCGDIPGLSGGKTSVMNLLAVDPGLVFSAYGVEILVSRLALVSVLRCRAGTHGLLGRLRVCSRLELGTGLLLPGLLGYRLSAGRDSPRRYHLDVLNRGAGQWAHRPGEVVVLCDCCAVGPDTNGQARHPYERRSVGLRLC